MNHDLGMTLTFLQQGFEWEEIGKCHLMAENLLGMSKMTEDLCL